MAATRNMTWTRVVVPASSANLGPGFDALGLALDLYLELHLQPAAEFRIEAEGCQSDRIPCDSSNLIWSTAARVAERLGLPLPPAHLRIRNGIPLGKGLGSSAAAVVAGVVLADRLLGLEWSRSQVLNQAARIEGHPDNAAASVFGKIVASATGTDGHTCAVRLSLPPECEIALLLPEQELATHHSRSALPDVYRREDIVYNLQHTALLVAALAAGDLEAFAAALNDRLHQPYRAALIPGLQKLLACRAPGLLGSVLSGAGPAVLVFYRRGCDVSGAFEEAAAGYRWTPVSPAKNGYQTGSL